MDLAQLRLVVLDFFDIKLDVIPVLQGDIEKIDQPQVLGGGHIKLNLDWMPIFGGRVQNKAKFHGQSLRSDTYIMVSV